MKCYMLCLTLHLSVSQLKYFVTKCWIKSQFLFKCYKLCCHIV